MKRCYLFLIISYLGLTSTLQAQVFGLAIHGGAGTITEDGLSSEAQERYEASLKLALESGYKVLAEGGSAEDAIVTAIRIMEDDSLFNSGRGSVLNAEGTVEMDASIMTGHDLDAGAVAGVRTVKHPIEAARSVMHDSPHVLMSNEGADRFAEQQGLEIESPDYFVTQRSKASLQKVKQRMKDQGHVPGQPADWKYGTVGAVALDKDGNLAAGTSTGGMTNKMHNRIGDSPIIGAGTYANNASCAVSCTGHGEYFIRLGVAREVSSLMRYKAYDLEKATSVVIHKQLAELGGSGGLIAIDRKGNVSMPFNTSGMFRAFKTIDGRSEVKMFQEIQH